MNVFRYKFLGLLVTNNDDAMAAERLRITTAMYFRFVGGVLMTIVLW